MKFIFLRSITLISGLILIATMMVAAPSKAGDTGAIAVVNAFHSVLLDMMKSAKKLGVKGRYEKVANRRCSLGKFDQSVGRQTLRISRNLEGWGNRSLGGHTEGPF
jgi:hypothetical protein